MKIIKAIFFLALINLANSSIAENKHWLDEVEWKKLYESGVSFYFLGSSYRIDIALNSLQGDSKLAEGWIRSHQPHQMWEIDEDNKRTGVKWAGEIVHISVNCLNGRMRANHLFYFDLYPMRVFPASMPPSKNSGQWRQFFENYGKFNIKGFKDETLTGLLYGSFCFPHGEVQSHFMKLRTKEPNELKKDR